MSSPTIELQPGQLVCDYASPKQPAAIVAAGYRGVVRYINGSLSSWKVLKPAELVSLHAAGLGVQLVWEREAARPLAGAAAGTADGTVASWHAAQLGYPTDQPIIVAVDIDTTARNLPAVVAYWQAFDAACSYPCGLYGDSDAIEALPASVVNYQAAASAWSHRTIHPRAHCRQLLGTSLGVDPDLVLRPFTMWRATPALRPVVPVPQPPLRIGARGALVTDLQLHLAARGLYRARVDGYYGPLTQQAVRGLQQQLGQLVDGYYGPATFAALTRSAATQPPVLRP